MSLACFASISAPESLTRLLEDETQKDDTRWTSLLNLAHLSGKKSLKLVSKYFNHSNWLLRDAAIKAAVLLQAKELQREIELRLKDNALTIRTAAVDAIEELNLRSSAPKLVDTLFDPINYRDGRALWIAKHILNTLKEFHYQPAAPKLAELLELKEKDRTLQIQIIETLESLTGRSFGKRPMKEQIYLWKRNTLSEVTF